MLAVLALAAHHHPPLTGPSGGDFPAGAAICIGILAFLFLKNTGKKK